MADLYTIDRRIQEAIEDLVRQLRYVEAGSEKQLRIAETIAVLRKSIESEPEESEPEESQNKHTS
jgi:hypothetical protein